MIIQEEHLINIFWHGIFGLMKKQTELLTG
jgi:hypothetical protein